MLDIRPTTRVYRFACKNLKIEHSRVKRRLRIRCCPNPETLCNLQARTAHWPNKRMQSSAACVWLIVILEKEKIWNCRRFGPTSTARVTMEHQSASFFIAPKSSNQLRVIKGHQRLAQYDGRRYSWFQQLCEMVAPRSITPQSRVHSGSSHYRSSALGLVQNLSASTIASILFLFGY